MVKVYEKLNEMIIEKFEDSDFKADLIVNIDDKGDYVENQLVEYLKSLDSPIDAAEYIKMGDVIQYEIDIEPTEQLFNMIYEITDNLFDINKDDHLDDEELIAALEELIDDNIKLIATMKPNTLLFKFNVLTNLDDYKANVKALNK